MNYPVIDAPVTVRTPASSAATACRRNAAWLGYAGLIPFVALSVGGLLFAGDIQQQAHEALIAYAAVIISFLGARHWYAAIYNTGGSATLASMSFAVTPALMGWVAVLLPPSSGMALVIAGLLMTCVADSRLKGLHAWYRVLRQRLTLIATVSMTVAVFSQL